MADREKQLKSLYRSMYESVQKIESMSRHVRDVSAVFGADMTEQRKRVRVLGERQLFLRSSRREKLEEIIWRKSFYDVIQMCKQNRQAFTSDSRLLLRMQNHVEKASCFYRHLVSRLERDFHLDLKGVVSWTKQTKQRHIQSHNHFTQDDEETREWAVSACHRCLVYLGDLARYQLEFQGGTVQLPVMYYKQAICLEPSIGLPHNQLALLLGNTNEECDSAFHYLMCLASRVPFPGVEHNLKRLWERNSNHLQQLEQAYCGEAKETDIQGVVFRRFLVRFLDLQRKLLPPCRISQEELASFCESVLHDFIDCLAFKLHQMDNAQSEREAGQTCHLSSTLMLKIVALSMLAAHKLRLQGSAVTAAATAFALSLYSQLLQHCTQSIDLWKKLLEQGRAPRGLVSLPCEHKETKDDSLKRNKPGQDRSDSEEETVQQGPRRRGKRRAASSRRRRHAMAESDSEEEEDETVRVEEVSEDDLSEGGGDFESDEVSPELSDLSDYEDSKAQETKSSDRDGGVKVQAKRPLAIRFPGMSEIQDHCEGTTSNTQGANFHNEVPGSDVHEQGCVPSDVHGKGSVNQDSNEKTQLDPTTAVLLRWLSCHHFLPSVKVVFDWLRIHPAIVASCTQSLSSFWSRMAELLNSLPSTDCLRHAGLDGTELGHEWKQVDPLPEDVELLGFPPLTRGLDLLQLNWVEKKPASTALMGLTRVQCLLSFGMFIADSKTVSVFGHNEATCKFVGPSQRVEQEAAKAADVSRQQELEDRVKREKLMKALAEQKLKSDVASLEQSLTQAVQSASPILVIDAQCLCTHLKIMRQFVASEQFIVVIPLHVIEALDDLKKGRENHTAREAIKFLEHQLKAGNRWIRAQQKEETSDGRAEDMPPRYKRKDIAAWQGLLSQKFLNQKLNYWVLL